MNVPTSIRGSATPPNRSRARGSLLILASMIVTGGLLAGANPARADTPADANPTLSAAPEATEARAASADLTSSWVTNDTTYGPAQIMQFRLKNTGTIATNYFDLQLADGTQFVDREGEQALIHCVDGAMPLEPGETITSNAYRLLTTKEIQRGTTDPQDVRVVLFGASGPKIPAQVGAIATGGIGQTRELRVTNPRSTVDLHDSSYGAVEKMQFDFENTGTMPTATLHTVAPDGLSYIDDEGEEMLLNCQAGIFPLEPGEKAACTQYRRLSAAEIAAGETIPQSVKFRAFGENGPVTAAPATSTTRFAATSVEATPAANTALDAAEVSAAAPVSSTAASGTPSAIVAAEAARGVAASASPESNATASGAAASAKDASSSRAALPYTGAAASGPFVAGAAGLLIAGCAALTIARIRRRAASPAAEATR